MPNPKTDQQGFATENTDKQRDESAKGGAVTGPGNPTDKHGISAPYDEDLQTQIATNRKKGKKEATGKSKKDHKKP